MLRNRQEPTTEEGKCNMEGDSGKLRIQMNQRDSLWANIFPEKEETVLVVHCVSSPLLLKLPVKVYRRRFPLTVTDGPPHTFIFLFQAHERERKDCFSPLCFALTWQQGTGAMVTSSFPSSWHGGKQGSFSSRQRSKDQKCEKLM